MTKGFFSLLLKTGLFIWVSLSVSGCGQKSRQEIKPVRHVDNGIKVDTILKRRLSDFSVAPRPQGLFGLYVYDLTAKKEVWGDHPDLAMPSASCLKLLTGVAALRLLGSHFGWITSVFVKGDVVADTLKGDVALKGSLDPNFNEMDFRPLAEALRKAGVKVVGGSVKLDLILHSPVRSEQHWYPWDLSFSRYGLFYKGPSRIRKAFRQALQNQGIVVKDNQITLGRMSPGFKLVARVRHDILPVIGRMWKNSSNTQATAMLYTIGHFLDPKGSPQEAGVKYLRSFLSDTLGIRQPQVTVHDGCGLCVHNVLTPRVLVKILSYGYRLAEIRNVMWKQLSVGGVDGTLRGSLQRASVRGKVRGKTGTLSHPYGISSLAGFAEGRNGHVIAFALMDSQMSVLDAHVLQRKLAEILVE